MVIAEAAYLTGRQPGAKAEASLYASIIDGQLEVADLGIAGWHRIQDLVSTYADLRLGGTDASVAAVAERHGAVRIAPLNRRHFAVAGPRHAEASELLPQHGSRSGRSSPAARGPAPEPAVSLGRLSRTPRSEHDPGGTV